MGRNAKLKHDDGCWLDVVSGLFIRGKQRVAEDGPHGQRVRELVSAGMLEWCNDASTPEDEGQESGSDARVREEGPAEAVGADLSVRPETPETREAFLARTVKRLMDTMTVKELREECRKAGVKTPKRAKERDLAKALAAAEWEKQQG